MTAPSLAQILQWCLHCTHNPGCYEAYSKMLSNASSLFYKNSAPVMFLLAILCHSNVASVLSALFWNVLASPSNRTHSLTLVTVDMSPPEIYSSDHDEATKTHPQQLGCQEHVKKSVFLSQWFELWMVEVAFHCESK